MCLLVALFSSTHQKVWWRWRWCRSRLKKISSFFCQTLLLFQSSAAQISKKHAHSPSLSFFFLLQDLLLLLFPSPSQKAIPPSDVALSPLFSPPSPFLPSPTPPVKEREKGGGEVADDDEFLDSAALLPINCSNKR